MSKSHDSYKQTKKQPLLTPKEKRAAKRAKKHPHHEDMIAPLVTH